MRERPDPPAMPFAAGAGASRRAPVVAEPRVFLDPRGRILAASGPIAPLLGAHPDQLTGLAFADLLRGDSRPVFAELLAAARDRVDPVRAVVVVGGRHPRAASVELLLAASDTSAVVGATLVAYLHDVSGPVLAERLRAADATVVTALAAGQTAREAAQRLLGVLAEALHASRAHCLTRSGEDDLELVAAWPDPALGPMDAWGSASVQIAARTLATGRLAWSEDPDADDAGGLLAVPLGRDAQLRSAVVLATAGEGAPDATTLDAIADAAARAGELLAILQERQSSIDSLARLALTDELTGLPNRRAWEEMLTRELSRAARDGQPVCVAVLDLDRFKDFNDAHGHQAGDRLLRDAARAWQRQLRLSDLLARYGGEEFAAIIPACPPPTAEAVVDRLRRATPGGLTASAGIASWDGSETGADLFGRADAALYVAKQTGRDRTIAAASPDDAAVTSPDRSGAGRAGPAERPRVS